MVPWWSFTTRAVAVPALKLVEHNRLDLDMPVKGEACTAVIRRDKFRGALEEPSCSTNKITHKGRLTDNISNLSGKFLV
jgi:hypothetical protein